jgi:hypothetical protein
VQTLLAVALAALPASPASDVEHYWQQIPRCDSGHSAPAARKRLRRLLKNHRPLTAHVHERAAQLRRCTLTRSARRELRPFVRRLRHWRMGYAHVWPIRFARLASWLRSWAWSTSACESGGTHDPSLATGNGFYGAFQWVPSTWYAAGGDRWPSLASWHHQAVLAVRFMLRYGAQHWPVCG